jgi:hypothetical protein
MGLIGCLHCAWAGDAAWIARRDGALNINLPSETITILQYDRGPKIQIQDKTLATFTEEMSIDPTDTIVISPDRKLIRILICRRYLSGSSSAIICSLQKFGNDWVSSQLQLPVRKPRDAAISVLGAVGNEGKTMLVRMMVAHSMDPEGKEIFYYYKWELIQYPSLAVIPNGFQLDGLGKYAKFGEIGDREQKATKANPTADQ